MEVLYFSLLHSLFLVFTSIFSLAERLRGSNRNKALLCRFCCILLLLILSNVSLAQTDTLYVEEISNAKNVAIQTTVNNFRVSFYGSDSDKISFQNYHLGLGLRLKYQKIGIGFSVPVKSFVVAGEGRPVFYNLNFTLYPSSFLVQGEFRYIKGFDDLRNIGNGSTFRSDDRMIVAGLAGTYLFNSKRFSLRSAFKLVNRQKRSAGSWLVSVPIAYHSFVGDSLSLKLANQQSFELGTYQSMKIGFGGGYAYTQVMRHWATTLLASGGLELRQLRYAHATTTTTRNQFLISPSLRFLASLVYNKDHLFGGLLGHYLPGIDRIDGLNTRVENWRIRLMIGYRFY